METQKKRPFIKKTPLSFDRWEIWTTLRRILGIQIETVKIPLQENEILSLSGEDLPENSRIITRKGDRMLTKESKSFKIIRMKAFAKRFNKTNKSCNILKNGKMTRHKNIPENTDVLVIGGGSAGRYAAKAAARKGARVTLVDPGPFGGLCILKGCMPSKALLRSAHVRHLIVSELPELGLRLSGGQVDLDMNYIVDAKDRMIKEFADDALQGILNNPSITLVEGLFRFTGPHEGSISGAPISFRKAIIASGTRIRLPHIKGLEAKDIMTSDDILETRILPKKVVVIGTGPVGLELGQYLHNMGSDVTILNINPEWGHGLDRTISDAYLDALRARGLPIHMGITNEWVENTPLGPIMHYIHNGKEHSCPFDRLLSAIGRTPDTHILDLPAAGVETAEKGIIKVLSTLQTTNPDIYAAGDVTGILPVLNVATFHGEMAGENATREQPLPVPEPPVPIAIFTDPEYARSGLSENEALHKGYSVITGKIPFTDLGKAIVYRRTDGWLKIVADEKDRKILGAEMFGPGASDLIHVIHVAIALGATLDDYQRILHIHPTFAEIFKYLVDDLTDAI